jgi:hypothetical protein
MFYGYGYPFYRSPYINNFGFGYPTWNYGGYGNGYGNNYGGINAVGSAISNQSLINTGIATGINQISTPSVIY